MINYSVIIPHKNIPQLLQRCLDSIPLRKDIQVIVVDDNSDASKVDFEHFPGLNRPNAQVIFTKEGKGAGYARNVGLKYAKGRWVLFADADDYYTDKAWPVFDEHLEDEVDILYFSVDFVDSETLLPATRNMKNNQVVKSYLAREQDGEIMLRYTCWEPWNKMWKRTFISANNLLFEEIPKGNDAMFVLHGGDKAHKIQAVDIPLYVVTYRKDSLTYNLNIETLKSSCLLRIRINKFYKERNLRYLRCPLLCFVKRAYVDYGLKSALYFLWLIIVNKGDIWFSLKSVIEKRIAGSRI